MRPRRRAPLPGEPIFRARSLDSCNRTAAAPTTSPNRPRGAVARRRRRRHPFTRATAAAALLGSIPTHATAATASATSAVASAAQRTAAGPAAATLHATRPAAAVAAATAATAVVGRQTAAPAPRRTARTTAAGRRASLPARLVAARRASPGRASVIRAARARRNRSRADDACAVPAARCRLHGADRVQLLPGWFLDDADGGSAARAIRQGHAVHVRATVAGDIAAFDAAAFEARLCAYLQQCARVQRRTDGRGGERARLRRRQRHGCPSIGAAARLAGLSEAELSHQLGVEVEGGVTLESDDDTATMLTADALSPTLCPRRESARAATTPAASASPARSAAFARPTTIVATATA